MVNHECMGPEPLYRGHEGYMAPEYVPTLASDIHSMGVVILYYMAQWKQEDANLIDLVKKMVTVSACAETTTEKTNMCQIHPQIQSATRTCFD